MEKLASSRTRINNMGLERTDEDDDNFYDFCLKQKFCLFFSLRVPQIRRPCLLG